MANTQNLDDFVGECSMFNMVEENMCLGVRYTRAYWLERYGMFQPNRIKFIIKIIYAPKEEKNWAKQDGLLKYVYRPISSDVRLLPDETLRNQEVP